MKQLFILDEETRFIFPDKRDQDIVISEEELYKLEEYKTSLESIIIFVELNWPERTLQDFYGFDIALSIRRELQLICPIILVSSLEKAFFEQQAEQSKSEVKYRLLYSRGTYFCSINQIITQLESIISQTQEQPISNAVLTDMNTMLFNQQGYLIDRITHDLKPSLEPHQLQTTLDEIAKFLNPNQFIELEWKGFVENLSNTASAISFNQIKEEFLIKCERGLESASKGIPSISEKQYKILVLEDDNTFREQLKTNLESAFETVICTGEANQAIQILQQDNSNEIVCILSDWRLYKNGSPYWQVQGYEVLQYAAHHHFIALFGLTSLSDRNVHNIRNELGLDIHLFKKQHIQNTDFANWEILIDTIKQKAEKVLQLIATQPSSTSWQKLQPSYIKHRGKGWKTFENEIAANATALLNYYWEAIEGKTFRGVNNFTELGLPLKNNLTNVLIGRRVFMGLYFRLIKSKEYLQSISSTLLGEGNDTSSELRQAAFDTHSILKKDWWDDLSAGLNSIEEKEVWKKYVNRVKILRTSLSLKLTELPYKGILPEEKSWLHSNNIDFSIQYNFLTEEEF